MFAFDHDHHHRRRRSSGRPGRMRFSGMRDGGPAMGNVICVRQWSVSNKGRFNGKTLPLGHRNAHRTLQCEGQPPSVHHNIDMCHVCGFFELKGRLVGEKVSFFVCGNYWAIAQRIILLCWRGLTSKWVWLVLFEIWNVSTNS